MKKLFIVFFISAIGIAYANDLNSNSGSSGAIVIKQDCKYYADGVKINLQGKNVKTVTMSYSKNYTQFANLCQSEINNLLPDLKIEPKLISADTMPTISYTTK